MTWLTPSIFLVHGPDSGKMALTFLPASIRSGIPGAANGVKPAFPHNSTNYLVGRGRNKISRTNFTSSGSYRIHDELSWNDVGIEFQFRFYSGLTRARPNFNLMQNVRCIFYFNCTEKRVHTTVTKKICTL